MLCLCALPNDRPAPQRGVVVLYFAHLLVPLLLLLDVFDGRRYAVYGSLEKAVALAAALWLALGILLPLVVGRARFFRVAGGPLVTIYTVYAFVLIAEVGLRVTHPSPKEPFLYQPGFSMVFHPDPAVLPGMPTGVSRFTVNDVGLRGPALPRNPEIHSYYKIATVGGSSTECMYLDDAKEWPHLLMEKLNGMQRRYPVQIASTESLARDVPQKQRPVWVANAGVSGHTGVQHLMLMDTLPILRKMDLIIITMGVNDLTRTLFRRGGPSQEFLERATAVAREDILAGGWPRHPYFRRLKLVVLLRHALLALRSLGGHTFAQSGDGRELIVFRQQRASGVQSAPRPLPDLTLGLQEYRNRINALAQACQRLNLRCLFVTQPAMWRADMKPGEETLLWFGWVGEDANAGYASTADLSRAMLAYNRTLLEQCQERHLECFDMASAVPLDTSTFYDDVHFNQGGAERVATNLAAYLAAKPPFTSEAAKESKSIRP